MTSGRSRRSSSPAIVLLLLEVAAIEHAGELDDALQLELAPAAADAGPLERVDQTRGLRAEVLPRRVQRAQPLDELRAALACGGARSP